MQSIQSKLGSGLLLSLVIAFSSLWFLVSTNIQYLAQDYIAARLEHDAATLLGTLRFDDKGQLFIDKARIDLIYKQPFSGHYYVISTDDKTINSRSLWDYKPEVKKVNTGDKLRILQPGPVHQSLLFISIGYKKQGKAVTISIAEDLNTINENINEFKYGFAAISLGMLLALVVLQVLLLKRSLRPLNRMHHELKLLQQGKCTKLSTESPDEIRPLINELNHLLSLMEQRLHRSRNAISDLAHAIKKPLTVIKQLAEKSDLSEKTRTGLLKQTNDIYQISDHILKRARLAGHSHTGSLFVFSRDLPALIKTLDMMYASKSYQLEIQMPETVNCPVDREDMLELLGNLLDNAYKWAEQLISITVTEDSELHIVIEDDGKGAADEKMGELSKRGVRLDEKIMGHGFGLAITADIINDYNGSIQFSKSSRLGGFKVNIILPLQN